jgi:hypothetical protein
MPGYAAAGCLLAVRLCLAGAGECHGALRAAWTLLQVGVSARVIVDAVLDDRRELMGSSQGDQACGPIRCHRLGRRDAGISATERDHAVVVVVSENGY